MTLARTVTAALGPDAAATRGRAVLLDGTNAWDAKGLVGAIEGTADQLRDHPLAPDAVAAMLLPSGAALLVTLLAAGEVPLTPAVLDPGWDDAVLSDVLRRLRPDAVLTDRAGLERLEGLLRTTGSQDTAAPVVIDLDAGVPHGPGPARAKRSGSVQPGSVQPGSGPSPRFILMTSGSTGPPKGVRRTHDSWLRSFDATREFGPTAADRVLVPGSLTSSWFLYAAVEALCAGAAVRIGDGPRAAPVVRALTDWPATRIAVVPTLLEQCVATATRRGLTSPALRHVVSCGGVWPGGLYARTRAVAPTVRIHDIYGAAEWSVVSVHEITAATADGDLGLPVPGVEVSIRDEQQRPVPPSEAGVLWVRSPLTFEAYVGDEPRVEPGGGAPAPAATGSPPEARGSADQTVATDLAARDDAGFIAVGDLVREVDGQLSLVGRRDHVLVCRGHKVHPELVETALRQFDGVIDAAVTVAVDEARGEHLVALLEGVGGDGADRAGRRALRRHVRDRLPPAARPARFVHVTRLPRTRPGKLDRSRLAPLVDADHLVPTRP